MSGDGELESAINNDDDNGKVVPSEPMRAVDLPADLMWQRSFAEYFRTH